MKNMISTNLKNLRKRNNYTQEQVAEQLNVSRQVVAKWEKVNLRQIFHTVQH